MPSYAGPLDGLPLNLEALLRRLEATFGSDLSAFEKLRLPVTLQRLLDRNEDYWERGAGRKPPRTDLRYANLGIYGWDVRDAISATAMRASLRVGSRPDDSFTGAKPDHDNDIAALSVLAPFGMQATQLEAARLHGRNGGIDTLVVVLGANNALGAVVDKRPDWSDVGYDDLDRKGPYNVWRPIHFAAEYGALVAGLRTIAARRVVLATVPHVTIAPMAQGVNPDPSRRGKKWRDGSRYFPYYTDPWIAEKDFRPDKHRHLTHQQARAIDAAIDQYNDVIAAAVGDARRDGREWLLVDLCGVLDGLATRRYHDDPEASSRHPWQAGELPPAIADLDTRFFRANRRGRRAGGLFGLDGIHPTTVGYGVIAQSVLDLLAGVGVPSTPLDFAALRRADTLVAAPPPLVDELFAQLAPFATRFLTRRR